MNNPLSYKELHCILNDASDAATLAQGFITDLSIMFDAIHAIASSTPEPGVDHECHHIGVVRISRGLAKIGSYLADDWSNSLDRATGDLQQKIAALKESQGIAPH